MDLDALARKLNVLEQVDSSPCQRRARVLQSIWPKSRGLHVRGTGGLGRSDPFR
jgi:hypothetical protein